MFVASAKCISIASGCDVCELRLKVRVFRSKNESRHRPVNFYEAPLAPVLLALDLYSKFKATNDPMHACVCVL